MKFSEMPYTRPDLDEYKAEFEKLIAALKAAKSGEEQFEVHKKYYSLYKKWLTASVLVEIRHSINTEDSFYKGEQDFFDENGPVFNVLLNNYRKELYESPYREYLEEKIGKVAFKNIELSLKAFDEKLVPLMQEENNLVTGYEGLLASAKIDWDGEVLNLSMLGKYMTSEDRDTRIRAWKKNAEFFEAHAGEFDEFYDKLVKNRTEQAKMLGFKDYTELGYLRMQRNDYGVKEVEAFRDQVKKYLVPLAEKLHDERRERLGLDKLLYYDEKVNFKNGNPAPTGTPDEILSEGKKMYSELSPETKEFMDFMTENELFDVYARKGKRTGGFMTYLPDYASPFVFANFNGTAGDVDVITHECGHAFQGYLSGKDPILEHSDITMETAETHSMSMEFFTEPWMERFFGDRYKDYITMHLEEAVTFIPYGCMVDEFQHIVYANPGMTPAERKAAWRGLERVYKPHLDYEGCEYLEAGGFWQRQHHIYSLPFYYIDYCIAQTDALQYKVWMDRDYKAAWKSYLEFCYLSASGFFSDMIKQVGLKSPFEAGCLEEIAKGISEKLKNPGGTK